MVGNLMSELDGLFSWSSLGTGFDVSFEVL